VKLAPAATVEVLYALFATCGRLGCSLDEWNVYILFPVYKGTGDPAEPGNNRPLRFVSSIRNIYPAAGEATVASEVQNHGQQFGFQHKTSSTRPLLNVISILNHAQEVGTNHIPLTTISLDMRQTNYYIRRDMLLKVLDERVSATTAALVAMLMQVGMVYTAEDWTGLILRVHVGLTQGEPSSPTLYDLYADCLLEALTEASRLLSVYPTTTTKTQEEQVSNKKNIRELVCFATIRPMETAFAGDTILQDAVAPKAQIELDVSAMWARKSGMHWNLGKACVMLQPGVCPPAGGF
jgi:hypothetical protein